MKNVIVKRLVIPALALGLVATAAACGDDDDDTSAVSGASADVCTQITNLASDLQAAPPVDASTTVDQAKDLQKTISDDLADIAAARGDLAQERVDALQNAWKAYGDQLSSISGSSTLAAAAPTVNCLLYTSPSPRDS